jgi:hypothetical protein
MVSAKQAKHTIYLRYTDDDVRFIFASVITGTLPPSVLIGTLSLKCTSALRICADEKTMYMNQLAKFCCILCRADAQRRLFGETLSWLAGDAFVTFHIVTSTEMQLVLFKIEHYLCTLCAPFFLSNVHMHVLTDGCIISSSLFLICWTDWTMIVHISSQQWILGWYLLRQFYVFFSVQCFKLQEKGPKMGS